MQSQQLIEKLTQLKCHGMAEALSNLLSEKNQQDLSFNEQLALLIDKEEIYRGNKKLYTLLKQAKFRQSAHLEDILWQAQRGLNKSYILGLCNGGFVAHKHNLVITGATGCGKTYLACAIGHKICQSGYRVHYLHLPRFIEDLAIARADGSLLKLIKGLNKFDLLILDDFGLTPMTSTQRHDLFSIIEERYQLKSTMMTSQLPINKWHNYLTEPTLADAILDRILEHVERVELQGESLRKQKKLVAA
jgi:DNA replication protein DnaC